MTCEQKKAYEWIKNQEYNSVSVAYAKILITAIDELLVANQALRNSANGFKARCDRLNEARERANEACAKWEERCRMAEARAEKAEKELKAALAAAVRDMEAMALTIRQRRDHDTECCPFCKYDCPEEDYCPGWEGEECFRWRGSDQSHKPTGDLSRDATKMVPLTLEQLRRRVEKAGKPVVVFVVTIDPDTGERDFDGDWEMFDGDDFVADGSWDTYTNYGVTFEAYGCPPNPLPERG